MRYGRVPKRSREVITSAEADQSSYDGTPQSASPGSNSSSEGGNSTASSFNSSNGSDSGNSTLSSTGTETISVSSTFTSTVSPLAHLITQSHLQHCVYIQDKVRDLPPRKLTSVRLF